MKAKQIVLLILISATTSIFSMWVVQKFSKPENGYFQEATPAQLTNFKVSSGTGLTDFTLAAEKTIHAVVHVKTQSSRSGMAISSPFDFFFGYRNDHNPEPVLGSGSGVIISNDGYIVTNNHVIDGAEVIEVILNDKSSYTASVVGADPSTDIALLKVNEKNLPFLSLGNSDEVKVGEWVLAVGNPFNLTSTVTAGIVSAKARNINILSQQFAIESFIQTDAAVNPGNSGGALVNLSGDLIGINAAIASRTGSYVGYSFAIPVNIVKKIVADMIEFGKVQRAFIGVSIQDIDGEKAKELGMSRSMGVLVSGLSVGGAASDAGIEEGDVITHIGQLPVNSVAELQEQISKFRPGDKVDVAVLRNGGKRNVTVTLRNKNNKVDIVTNQEISLFGAKLEEASTKEKNVLGLKVGVKVVDIQPGKFAKAGIKKGFIITSINRQIVYSPDDVTAILENSKGGVFIEGVYPNGMTAYYAFGI